MTERDVASKQRLQHLVDMQTPTRTQWGSGWRGRGGPYWLGLMSRCTMPELWMYLSPREICRRMSLSFGSWKWLPDFVFSDIAVCKLPPRKEQQSSPTEWRKVCVLIRKSIVNSHEISCEWVQSNLSKLSSFSVNHNICSLSIPQTRWRRVTGLLKKKIKCHTPGIQYVVLLPWVCPKSHFKSVF